MTPCPECCYSLHFQISSERAENLVPAILSFFFHGVGYLFQGRFFKFVFTLTVSFVIWYDFYALHVVGASVGEFIQGWVDLQTLASVTHNVLMALKAFAEMDHPKIVLVARCSVRKIFLDPPLPLAVL